MVCSLICDIKYRIIWHDELNMAMNKQVQSFRRNESICLSTLNFTIAAQVINAFGSNRSSIRLARFIWDDSSENIFLPLLVGLLKCVMAAEGPIGNYDINRFLPSMAIMQGKIPMPEKIYASAKCVTILAASAIKVYICV